MRASIITWEGSASLGNPKVKGATSKSGNASALATKAMGACMVSNRWKSGEVFTPSSSPAFRYLANCCRFRALASPTTGPITISTSSL